MNKPGSDLPAEIPVLPVLSGMSDLHSTSSDVPSILDAGPALWLQSGSMAIYAALRCAGVTSGDEVLLPAFHCPSMVAPVLMAKATPVFYCVTEELRVELQEIASRITTATKAVIVPHLFGRIQDLRAIRQLCDERGMWLIEDCAHAFFGSINMLPVGSTGHYAIASPRKFFPLVEGGILVINVGQDRELEIARPGMIATLKGAFDMVDKAVRYGRLRSCAPFIRLAKRVVRKEKAISGPTVAKAAAASEPVVSESGVIRGATAATRFSVRHFGYENILNKRHQNFDRLVSMVRACQKLQVLDIVNEISVPYMVPVLLTKPVGQFDSLKKQGLPMWRWEYSVRGVCKVTDWYAESLIQIPCHQSLTAAELTRIQRIVVAEEEQ